MKMTDRSADVPRLTSAAGPRLSASAPKLNAGGPRLASEGAPRLMNAGASRLMTAGAPRLKSSGPAPRQTSAGAPKPSADAPKLYPDLTEFYAPGAASKDRPPSPTELGASPPQPPPVHTHRLPPTAPPLWLPDPRDNGTLHAGEDLSWEDLVELAPDYDTDMDDPDQNTVMLNHLNNNLSHRLDVTIDYSLQGLSWDDFLELEPDYDDDADDDPVHHRTHHHQDNLNQLNDVLNNLNMTATDEGKQKILHDKNIELPPPDNEPSQPQPRPRPPAQHLPPPRTRDDRDFRAWLTWRLQANKQLAAVILTREGRKRMLVRQSEMRRKPLTRHVVQKVVQQARGGGEGGRGVRAGGGRGVGGDCADRTSLPACPYVMYGIPRVNLPANPSPAATTTTTTTTNQP